MAADFLGLKPCLRSVVISILINRKLVFIDGLVIRLVGTLSDPTV